MTSETVSRPGTHAGSLAGRLKDIPVLGREEELQLALRYRETQDREAERRLIEGHLWLVIKIARSCCFRQSALPDVIQEGTLGLMRAVRKYDPARGVRLSTYAAWWIRAYVYQHVMANEHVLRVAKTVPQRKLFFALRREQARLDAVGERLEPVTLAGRLGVSPEDVVEMQARLSTREVPLSTGPGEAGDAPVGLELRDESAGPYEIVSSKELRKVVRERMKMLESSLCERERQILEQRLTADEPATLQEVGKQFGISRERVRQLEHRLKQMLMAHLRVVAPVAEAS